MGIAALIVAGGTLLSRVLGLLRQVVFAWLLGAGAAGDEYFVAFVIPDFLNHLLAGAYMAITLIPILTRRFAAGDEEDAWRAFWAVARVLVIGSVILLAAAMPFVSRCCAPWNRGSATPRSPRPPASPASCSPPRSFFILGQLFTAVQFARERFVIATLGPIIYNLGIILGGMAGALGREQPTAEGFAWGVLGGSFVGIFLLQWWGARRCGLKWVAGSLRRHPAVPRYFALAIPLMLGQTLVVLDEQLGRTFGSFIKDGGVSWLTFGRQTMLVPVGVIAQAAGVAAYPFLARLAAEGKHRETGRGGEPRPALHRGVQPGRRRRPDRPVDAGSAPAVRAGVFRRRRHPGHRAAPWCSSPWGCPCGGCSRSWPAASTPVRRCGPRSSSAPWPPPPPSPSTGACTRPWGWTAWPWPPASPSPCTPWRWPSSGTGAPGGSTPGRWR